MIGQMGEGKDCPGERLNDQLAGEQVLYSPTFTKSWLRGGKPRGKKPLPGCGKQIVQGQVVQKTRQKKMSNQKGHNYN